MRNRSPCNTFTTAQQRVRTCDTSPRKTVLDLVERAVEASVWLQLKATGRTDLLAGVENTPRMMSLPCILMMGLVECSRLK